MEVESVRDGNVHSGVCDADHGAVMPVATDYAPLLEKCLLLDASEDSCQLSVTGTIPSWLRGTYYVNGPSLFQRGGRKYHHWLDGDGMVHSLDFSDVGIRYTSRFVRTPKYEQEQAAGDFIYRTFGTAFAGDKLRAGVMLESPLNVSVYPFAGKLLAFGEQSLPFLLDPETLATVGEYDFDAALTQVTPFSAHPKREPGTGKLLNFGVSFMSAQPSLHLFEFDSAGNLLRRRRHAIPLPHALHDFGFTRDYFVFYLSPLTMDFTRFASGGQSVLDSLSWEPQRGARILFVPREKSGPASFTVEVPAHYCLHLIDCWQSESRIVVDVLEQERPVYMDYAPMPDLFITEPICNPVRYVIDLNESKLLERQEMSYQCCPDFPSVDQRAVDGERNDFWMLGMSQSGRNGRKFFDHVARGSWRDGDVVDTWQAPAGEYLGGEPVCVMNPANPTDGVIVVELLRPSSDSAEFVLLDAFALNRGPVARVHAPHLIHPGFHASFSFAGENVA